MRFIKVLIFLLIMVLAMLFFVQNNVALSKTMQLQFDLFFSKWTSIELPFYFILLVTFFLGGLFVLMYFFIEKIRLASELRTQRNKCRKLEQELRSLRNMPLEREELAASAPAPVPETKAKRAKDKKEKKEKRIVEPTPAPEPVAESKGTEPAVEAEPVMEDKPLAEPEPEKPETPGPSFNAGFLSSSLGSTTDPSLDADSSDSAEGETGDREPEKT